MNNEFKIPASPTRASETIKKSRFIATVQRASSIEEAKKFIEKIKKEFPSASHNCWAYQTGEPRSSAFVGMSDDGEPRSTAGKPMLTVLINSGIGEIAAVVTRYFGGVKLGTGGLIRAYSGILKKALADIKVKKKIITADITFTAKYNDITSIKHIIEIFKAKTVEEIYKENVLFKVLVRKDKAEEFKTAITDILNYKPFP